MITKHHEGTSEIDLYGSNVDYVSLFVKYDVIC